MNNTIRYSSNDSKSNNNLNKNEKSEDDITNILSDSLNNTIRGEKEDNKSATKNSINENDDIYIDCSPTGESATDIATYNVPINSEYTRDAAKLDLMRALINLFIITIFLLITYFVIPIAYKKGVIDIISKLFPEDTYTYFDKDTKAKKEILGNKIRLNRIGSTDLYLSFISFLFISYHFYIGISKMKFSSSMVGLLAMLMYILAYSTIQVNKKDTANFMTSTLFVNDTTYKVVTEYPHENSDAVNQDIPKFITDFINYAFDGGMITAAIVVSIVIYFCILLIYFIFVRDITITSLFNKNLSELLFNLFLFGTFFITPFVSLLGLVFKSATKKKNNKPEY